MSNQYSSRSSNQAGGLIQGSTTRPTTQIGGFEGDAIRETLLRWSSIGDGREDIVIHG